ncbi:MAG TPA: TetR/AcrR family transcriptional regulator [Solirubrobacteraceae bacterium]|nr:TetR/AcrR family transcriptional regulator [Solirubrobacteraceae bacterium]
MAATRELGGEKAQRIVDAMRASLGARGAAGSTFDHVAREAGVSRGLLHYYFGTKERLLVEVVRRDCDIRMAMLDEAFAAAADADELIDALVRSLEDLVENDPGFIAMVFELFTSSRHNDELAQEMRELMRRVREHLAGLLAAKRAEGAIALGGEPDAVASVLFALADGLTLRMLSEPDVDFGTTIDAAVIAVRQLIRSV